MEELMLLFDAEFGLKLVGVDCPHLFRPDNRFRRVKLHLQKSGDVKLHDQAYKPVAFFNGFRFGESRGYLQAIGTEKTRLYLPYNDMVFLNNGTGPEKVVVANLTEFCSITFTRRILDEEIRCLDVIRQNLDSLSLAHLASISSVLKGR